MKRWSGGCELWCGDGGDGSPCQLAHIRVHIHTYVCTLMHKCIYPYVCTHIRAVGNCLANDS